jgi:hypothetical protein
MKRRKVLTCLTTSLLVVFYIVELIFRPNFETFFPPYSQVRYTLRNSQSIWSMGQRSYSSFSPDYFWRSRLSPANRLSFPKSFWKWFNLPLHATVYLYTHLSEFCGLCPEGRQTFPNSHSATTHIFFFNLCVKTDWKYQSGISLALG